jgi:diacylglycerol kinase family enzyme
MGRIVLIVNPYATRVTEPRVREVEEALAAAGDVETMLTEWPGHGRELAATAGDDADAIVVFSGDGVYNEAVNGSDLMVPLGFVPGGGTSVLPRGLGLAREPRRAAQQLAEAITAGRTRKISLGKVNGRRFAFSAGIGIDAEVVRRVDARGRREGKRRPGDSAFVMELARIAAEQRVRFEPELEIVGLGRAVCALVANGAPYTYAGPWPVHLVPGVTFEGGLGLTAPKSIRPLALPGILNFAFTGRGDAQKLDLLRGTDLERIEVVCDRPLALQVDGEDLGDVEQAVFTVDREILPVLAPGV